MWYLQMNAVLAMAGMIALLMVTQRWSSNKRVGLLLFNLGFLAVYSPRLAAFMAIYTAVNYIGFQFLSRVQRARRFWFLLWIAVNIIGVVLLRLFAMGTLHHPLFVAVITLGLIYQLLKVIDALYYAYYVGREAKASAIDYANYILFVPTFTSGPILKFRDFMADASKSYTVDALTFKVNSKRIILGMFKKIVVVTWMTALFDYVLKSQELHLWESLILMALFYVILYMDFSGYSDIAIGVGRLMGYQVPENFKKPFLAPTLTQFWRSWHASLGDWFRDHLFMPFSRQINNRWKAAGMALIIMLLMGLWHGFTWLYVYYGLYHGTVMAIENLLQKTTVNRKKVSSLYFYSRVALTQLIVMFSVIIYSGNMDTVMRIYKGLLQLG